MLNLMKILAIETSCDDTCIAVAKCQGNNFELLSNIVSSQIEVHKKFGGVYPSLARREHQKNLTTVLERALKEANIITNNKRPLSNDKCQIEKILEREKLLCGRLLKFLKKYKKPDIDLIAVTKGPGLDPCLWTGVNFAKALALAWKLPIVGINHIEAHILASFLEKTGSNFQFQELYINTLANQGSAEGRFLFLISNFQKKILPAISLIASGGHTQIILMKKVGHYNIIGETRDDAAGEAFDKIARILGLGYPGGPAIQKEAEKTINNKLSIKLPRPMLYTKDYDFSFSGLKTAVLYDVKKRKKQTQAYISAMAKESQQAIIDVLIKKTIKAAKGYKAKTIILGGGVSANKELQKQFKEKIKKENLNFALQIPRIEFCGDNAAMIAITACLRKNLKPVKLNTLVAEPNIRL